MEGANTPEQTPTPEQKGSSLEQLLITPDKRLTNFGLWAVTLADATRKLSPEETIKAVNQEVKPIKDSLRRAILESRENYPDEKYEDPKYWALEQPATDKLMDRGKSDQADGSFYLRAGAASHQAALLIKRVKRKVVPKIRNQNKST